MKTGVNFPPDSILRHKDKTLGRQPGCSDFASAEVCPHCARQAAIDCLTVCLHKLTLTDAPPSVVFQVRWAKAALEGGW